MKNLINTVAAAAVVGLIGCVGGIDQPPTDEPPIDEPPPTTEKQGKVIFDSDIYPMLAACAGCHNAQAPSGNTSGFYDPDPSKGYVTMTNVVAAVGDYTPTGAGFYTIVKPGNHQGMPTWTADQEAKILNWLEVEINERAGSGPAGPPSGEPPSAASQRLIREWSGCMTLDDFLATNMAQAWGRLDAQGNTECRDCHATGGNYFLANDQPEFMFNGITGATGSPISLYLLLQYFKVDVSQGVENAMVVVNTTSFEAVSTGGPGHNEHPRFNPDEAMDNLQAFYDATRAHITAGTCGPPRLP